MYQGEKAFWMPDNKKTKSYKEKKSDFQKDFEQNEKDFYSGRIKYREMIEFLNGISELGEKEEERRECLFCLFKGMEAQERANIEAVRFNVFLVQEAGRRNKKYEELSKEDVEGLLEEFPNKEEMKKSEDDAILFYERALKNWQDGLYVKRHTLELLICDIKRKRAERNKETENSKKELSNLKGEHRSIVNDIPERGLRAEAQFVYFINESAQNQKLSHLIEAHKALPLDDHKEKIDVEIVSQGKVFNVNLKSLDFDFGDEKTGSAILQKEKVKTSGTNIEMVVLDGRKIQELWRLLEKDEQSSRQKRALTNFVKNISDQFQGLDLLIKKEGGQGKTVLSAKQIMSGYSNVGNLVNWGYLEQQDSGNPEAILAGKKKLEAELKDKEILEKIRRTIQEEA